MSETKRDIKLTINSEDRKILSNVIAVCEDGRALFAHVSEQVSDQQSRNVFTSMAAVRAQIVDELAGQVSNTLDDSALDGTITGELRKWYTSAKVKFRDNKELAFIEEIEANEKRSLSILKKAVKNIHNRILSQRLASLTASFQISLDKMAVLKEVYR